jgi:hypothetical protein
MHFASARRWLGPALLLLALGACAAKPALRPFYSDGCSLFPDGTPGDPRRWCDCCYVHDLAYWRGGTEDERLAADTALRACVLEKTGDARLASAMFEAVRLGGAPVFPNWYRWGYGWPYGRGYAPLSEAEAAQVAERRAEYLRRNPGGYCRRE